MSLQLGPHTLDAIETGTLALDGGAMFGVVPRPLWEKKIAPDERNRIHMAARCLLVRSGGRTILVDVGLGEHWSEKERGLYGLPAKDETRCPELGRKGLGRRHNGLRCG